jgi:hypothetical protein
VGQMRGCVVIIDSIEDMRSFKEGGGLLSSNAWYKELHSEVTDGGRRWVPSTSVHMRGLCSSDGIGTALFAMVFMLWDGSSECRTTLRCSCCTVMLCSEVVVMRRRWGVVNTSCQPESTGPPTICRRSCWEAVHSGRSFIRMRCCH